MKYIIFGLGNFGASLAQKLTEAGNEVIGVDNNMDKVDSLKESVSHTVCMDSTDQFTVSGLPLKDTDVYVVVQQGDRLDTISNQFYGDASLWWIIASANNIHKAVFGLDDGTILRIPQDYISIINDFKK